MAKRADIQWGLTRVRNDHSLMVIEPKSNQLQVDLDGARALRSYSMQYSILRRAGLAKGWRERITVSKSGGSRVHVTITTPKRMSKLKRVTYQAVLGSDIKREAFNLCRVEKGNRYPIVFFERKHGQRKTLRSALEPIHPKRKTQPAKTA